MKQLNDKRLKRSLIYCLFFITFSCCKNLQAASTPSSNLPAPGSAGFIPTKSIGEYLMRLTAKDITRLTGRKFSLKERISLFFIRQQIKKQQRQADQKGLDHNAGVALLLGIVGLIVIFIPLLDIVSIPLAIIAISMGSKVKRQDPRNKKARTAILLGLITLGLALIAAIAVGIILSRGSL